MASRRPMGPPRGTSPSVSSSRPSSSHSYEQPPYSQDSSVVSEGEQEPEGPRFVQQPPPAQAEVSYVVVEAPPPLRSKPVLPTTSHPPSLVGPVELPKLKKQAKTLSVPLFKKFAADANHRISALKTAAEGLYETQQEIYESGMDHIDCLHKDLTSHHAKLTAEAKAKANLRVELEAAKKTIQQVKLEKGEVKKELTESKRAKKSVENKLSTADRKISTLKHEKGKLEQELKDLKKKVPKDTTDNSAIANAMLLKTHSAQVSAQLDFQKQQNKVAADLQKQEARTNAKTQRLNDMRESCSLLSVGGANGLFTTTMGHGGSSREPRSRSHSQEYRRRSRSRGGSRRRSRSRGGSRVRSRSRERSRGSGNRAST